MSFLRQVCTFSAEAVMITDAIRELPSRDQMLISHVFGDTESCRRTVCYRNGNGKRFAGSKKQAE